MGFPDNGSSLASTASKSACEVVAQVDFKDATRDGLINLFAIYGVENGTRSIAFSFSRYSFSTWDS
jgi:hypothetical protein